MTTVQRPDRTTRPKKRRRPAGWIPDQHGAWAMITLPPLAGIVIGGPSWRHLPLLAAWWVAYFVFHSGSLWLKSRRKPRYLPPVRAYALALLPLAVLLLAAAPWLIGWALWFAPLIAVSAWLIARRKDRSLLNDGVTVLAACLMTMVAFDAAHRPASFLSGVAFDPAGITGGLGEQTAWAWKVTLVLAVYFLGTIPHVKSLIRERDNPRYRAGSLAYHLLALAAAALAVATRWWPPAPAGFLIVVAATLALARAAAMPAIQRRTGPIRPMVIGVVEIGMSVLLGVVVLAA